jgi:ribosomal protein S18 acetylase RimI-like enzyme
MTVELETGFREADRAALVGLLRDYERSLGLSLEFQNYTAELAAFPGAYAPPGGCLVVARIDGAPVGLVGVRCLDAEKRIGELKRLYVAPYARQGGLGRRLAEAALREARALGYDKVRLDTLGSMTAAIRLYQALGFQEIAPYYDNPIAGTRYFELVLGSDP